MSHDKQHTISMMAATLLADPERKSDAIEVVAHCADLAIQTYDTVEILLAKQASERREQREASS